MAPRASRQVLNQGTAQEGEQVGMLEPGGHDSALNTRGVTGRGVGRVINVTCQALATLEALFSGREGSVQYWRCFHGGAEILWERGSYKYWGLGQLLLLCSMSRLILCSVIYLAALERVVGSPQTAPYKCKSGQ